MEYDSRKKLTNNIELFGLPGVGKSYCINKIAVKYKKKVNKIEKAFNFNKVKNIFIGLTKVRLYMVIVMLFKSQFNVGAMKLTLVFLERIGRSYNNQNSIFDEGIMQALWGYFFRIGYNEYIMDLALKKNIISLNQVLYVHSNKVSHQKNLHKREIGNFNFYDDNKYKKARNIMKSIVCKIRKYKINLYKNEVINAK